MDSTEQNRTEQNRTEQNRTEQNRTEQYSTVQYNIVQCSAVQCSAVQYRQAGKQIEKNGQSGHLSMRKNFSLSVCRHMPYQALQKRLTLSITASHQHFVERDRDQVRIPCKEYYHNEHHRCESDNTSQRETATEWTRGLHNSPTNNAGTVRRLFRLRLRRCHNIAPCTVPLPTQVSNQPSSPVSSCSERFTLLRGRGLLSAA